MTPPSASLWRRGTWSDRLPGPGAVRPHQVRTFPAAPPAHLRLLLSGGEGDAPDRLTVVFEVRGGDRLAGRPPWGQSLDVMGLLGNGFPIEREGRYLLVGGGIGVPPMLGCAQYAPGRCTAILGFRPGTG